MSGQGADRPAVEEEDDSLQELFEGALSLLRKKAPPPRPLQVHARTDETARAIPGLYPFQVHVRDILANDQAEPCNLLVASPTGSGKTFAIEEAARLTLAAEGREHLYVAQPLIALAEQVFSRLGGKTDPRICLRTGPSRKGEGEDVRVTVCTYEVLARKCLSDPEALAAVRWVVIDEVHYIGSDRGPVIQEILYACSGKRIVALSGTLPNQRQFAEFLSSVNGYPTFITGANRRPVPISFYAYTPGVAKCSALSLPHMPPAIDAGSIGGVRSKQDLLACLRCLQGHDSFPLLVVLFSCRKLDKMAGWACTLDLLDAAEKARVTWAFSKMEATLPEEDRPLFDALREQALRGIGRHHSHLPVPYLELVCRLAELRLARIVFSSSTLSAGINLPVRTVLLCGARMPQKDSTGEMSFDLLSPLLFHQLAGRAGRPGLEQEGYCVVATKGARGYCSAQGLVMRGPAPILPQSDLTQGDVLRARLMGRSAGYDRALFADPLLRQAVGFGTSWRQSAEALCAQTCTREERAAGRQVADAIRTVRSNPAVLPLARERGVGTGRELWQDDQGIFHISPASQAGHNAVALGTHSQRTPQVPLQHFEQVQAVKGALRVLSEATPKSLVVASLEFYARIHEEAYLGTPLAQEEQRLFDAIPDAYLDASRSVLSALGRATCAIRTVGAPCLVMDLLLEAGQIDASALASVLSAALGEGRSAPAAESAASNARAAQLLEAYPKLRAFDRLSEASLTEGLAKWMGGESLVSICADQDCSVGVLCRHLVRVHDFLEEIAQAFEELGVESVPHTCAVAAAAIQRGLPFLRRGAGRVSSEEE